MDGEVKRYRISRGNGNAANCREVVASWQKIVEVLSIHKAGNVKEEAGWICGGVFRNNYRNGENLLFRSLLTVDIDECCLDLDEIAFELDLMGLSYVAYSTWRSSTDSPRFRIVCPLSRTVSSSEYVNIVKWFSMQHKELNCDPCSFTPAQFMYMPSHEYGREREAFVFSGRGGEINVDEIFSRFEFGDSDDGIADGEFSELTSGLRNGHGGGADATGDDSSNNLDDFELALAHEPLDITDEEVELYLNAFSSGSDDYATWIKVGHALHHQYRGSAVGFEFWVEWSRNSDKFDLSIMKPKWKSFASERRKQPLTFASVIKWVKDSGGVVKTVSNSDSLSSDGVEGNKQSGRDIISYSKDVIDNQSFEQLKRKLRKISLHTLPLTARQQIAQDIYSRWGKQVGISKAAIVRELMPPRRGDASGMSVGVDDLAEGDGENAKEIRELMKGSVGGVDAPSWLDGWVYVESSCDYYNIDQNYSIRKEAFNAKYDRMPECVSNERSASSLALVDYRLLTVVDRMYFPLAGSIFTYMNKTYLNSYYRQGVLPCDEIDEDGMAVVNKMLRHISLTLSSEEEQELLLDWMCHLVQNSGVRINWALLLQGVQGSGKTYFSKILYGCLGDNVQQLDPNQFIKGNFSGWAQGAILNVVEEIRVSGDNRWSILDRMKPFITNDTIQIEEKFANSKTVPNFTSYFLLTNYQDALPLTTAERRYVIMYSRWQTEEQIYTELGGEDGAADYFDDLFSESERRIDAICAYLSTRAISERFKPKGRAPKTISREKMINYSTSQDNELIEDLINSYQCEVINENVVDITHLQYLIDNEFETLGVVLPKMNVLRRVLLELGYELLDKRFNIPSKDGKRKRHRVWAKSGFCHQEIHKILRIFYKIEG